MEVGLAEMVVLAIILSRLLVPLLIVRFPLPAILACLIIDAVDQTVFQAIVPDADLSGYQSYDKALDIYYLVIAYISTLRNWTSRFAVGIARFLIVYRLVGVVLFELSGERWFLFIFYEAVRLFWDPRRMSMRLLLGATAFIWIVIKLPQEWWIHIAQLDVTDIVQEQIFGVPAGTSWADTLATRPWVVIIAIVAFVTAIYAVRWVMKHRLPPPDRPLTIDADAEPGRAVDPARLEAMRRRLGSRVLGRELAEKLVLVALVSIIFGELLQVRSDPIELTLVVSAIVLVNAAASTFLALRGFSARTPLTAFLVTGLVNTGLLGVLWLLFELLDAPLDLYKTGFFMVLIALLVTLYDRYRPEHVARFSAAGT